MTLTQWPSSFNSHHEASAWRAREFQKGVEDGIYVPVLFHFFWCGVGILFLHMLIPGLKGPIARLSTLGINIAYNLWVIANCRSASPATGVVIGILSAWNILWAAAILVFNDAKRSFARVTREGEPSEQVGQNGSGGGTNTRANGNGHAKTYKKAPKEELRYSWQSYPADDITERAEWAFDLLTNFRGIAWNWKISGTPTRPPLVEAGLRQMDIDQAVKEDHAVTSAGRVRIESKSQLLLHNAWLVLKGYIIMDVCKLIINRDPFFWGVVDAPAPSHLPAIIVNSAALTQAYRLFTILTFVWCSLRTTFSLVPLIVVGIFGPVAGINGETWVYPDEYGSYNAVLTRGLAGFWGGWWHQVFRYGFQTGGRWLAGTVLGQSPKSPLGALIELCTSFYISGFLHVAMSTTMLGYTKPWSEMFLFFALQPAGIVAGLIFTHLLKMAGVSKRIPTWVGYAGNFVWVHGWLFLTLPLLVNDLMRGGLLLFEPLPFSPLRGLGFGVPGDGFFCWQNVVTSWHQDAVWWKTGLQV